MLVRRIGAMEQRTHGRLWLPVTVGVLGGIAYSVVDARFDAELVRGHLLGLLAPVHTFIDRILPVLTGALLGAIVFALGQRGRLAALEHERAAALRVRLEKVERDQAVWVLAATILHEVKNPLHTLGLLLDELAAEPGRGPGSRALLEKAQAQIARIAAELQLLRSLPGRGRSEPGPVRLDELTHALVEDLRTVAGPVELAEQAAPVTARADGLHVRLILENLVDNAAQAARLGAHPPRVRLTVGEAEGRAFVRVADTGRGPSEAIAPRLFEPLHSTKESGLGLGLAVSRALARALDGDLVYEGRLDDETRFLLTLPCERHEVAS